MEDLLVGIDQMEPSKLRRALDPWNPSKADRIRPLVSKIVARYRHPRSICEPKWDVSVYPLYYYFYCRQTPKKASLTYEAIIETCSKVFPGLNGHADGPKQYGYIQGVADTEVDLLIEDRDYFIFVEVKYPPTGKTAKFETTHGIHQLVRQYLQGTILTRLTGKLFMLATLGVPSRRVTLTSLDKHLLDAVGARDPLHIPAFGWEVLPCDRDSGSSTNEPEEQCLCLLSASEDGQNLACNEHRAISVS